MYICMVYTSLCTSRCDYKGSSNTQNTFFSSRSIVKRNSIIRQLIFCKYPHHNKILGYAFACTYIHMYVERFYDCTVHIVQHIYICMYKC